MKEERKDLEVWKDFYGTLNLKEEKLTSNLTMIKDI